MDQPSHTRFDSFLRTVAPISPKAVAYTIFPFNMPRSFTARARLFSKYISKFYPWTRSQAHSGWGTYFHRMIAYPSTTTPVNQLENIISAINDRSSTSRAAYTIVIQRPGGETVRPLGGPCLNYIAVQIKKGNPNILSLLATYRNHDFLTRAYGNYWGLCELTKFIAHETNSRPGALTCVSSHAFVADHKPALAAFISSQ